MKTPIETLIFPCEVIDKIKIKTSFKNLSIRFVNDHTIKFNKTNLSIRKPHKIIISNSYNTLVAPLYDDTNKIYILNDNAVIKLSKFIQIINTMNTSKLSKKQKLHKIDYIKSYKKFKW